MSDPRNYSPPTEDEETTRFEAEACEFPIIDLEMDGTFVKGFFDESLDTEDFDF